MCFVLPPQLDVLSSTLQYVAAVAVAVAGMAAAAIAVAVAVVAVAVAVSSVARSSSGRSSSSSCSSRICSSWGEGLQLLVQLDHVQLFLFVPLSGVCPCVFCHATICSYVLHAMPCNG